MLAAWMVVALGLGQVEVKLTDGSVVVMESHDKTIEVTTKYGTLTVPLSEIRKIEFGTHFSEEFAIAAKQRLSGLGSSTYKNREIAETELLGMGKAIYPWLHEVYSIDYGKPDATDIEMKVRVQKLMTKLQEKHSNLRGMTEDKIHTTSFVFSGMIKSPTIKGTSKTLGPLSLKLESLVSLVSFDQFDKSLKVSPNQGWLDTGVDGKIVVTATGHVDLWPAGPGQYMAKPNGFSGAGRGGKFMAGALIGKIGDGPEFMVGERCSTEGKLYLRIVENGWNSASSGHYDVRIEYER